MCINRQLVINMMHTFLAILLALTFVTTACAQLCADVNCPFMAGYFLMLKRVPLPTTCLAKPCNTGTCCVLSCGGHSCGGQNTQILNAMTTPCADQPCQSSQCCGSVKTCTTYTGGCADQNFIQFQALPLNTECAAATCVRSDCCVERETQTCEYTTCTGGLVKRAALPLACTSCLDECCTTLAVVAPTCADTECTGGLVKRDPLPTTCTNCLDDCCTTPAVEMQTCVQFNCDGGPSVRKEDGVCANTFCEDFECCDDVVSVSVSPKTEPPEAVLSASPGTVAPPTETGPGTETNPEDASTKDGVGAAKGSEDSMVVPLLIGAVFALVGIVVGVYVLRARKVKTMQNDIAVTNRAPVII
jgi:hypothetical protein